MINQIIIKTLNHLKNNKSHQRRISSILLDPITKPYNNHSILKNLKNIYIINTCFLLAYTELPCLVEKKLVRVKTNFESEKGNPAQGIMFWLP